MIEPVPCRDCGSLPVYTSEEIKGSSFIEYDISHRCPATGFVHRGARGVDSESVIKQWNAQQQLVCGAMKAITSIG